MLLGLLLYGLALILLIYIIINIALTRKFKTGDAIAVLGIVVTILVALKITPPLTIPPLFFPTNAPVELRVYANQGWQNSGVSVNKGDKVVIVYISDLWFTDDPNGGRDASGAPNEWICGSPECHEPLYDFPKFALIGKIGDTIDFLKVGNYLEFEASSSGILYLRPNYGDEDIASLNPAGSIVVKITVP